MNLLIDDLRPGIDFDVVARSPRVAMLLLENNDWDLVSFDHDLGSNLDGYDVLSWAITNDRLPIRVELITSNPVGLKRMQDALLAENYINSLDGRVYTLS